MISLLFQYITSFLSLYTTLLSVLKEEEVVLVKVHFGRLFLLWNSFLLTLRQQRMTTLLCGPLKTIL